MADKTVSLEVDVDVVGGESVEKLEKDLKDIEKELSKTKGGKKFDALNKQLTITKSKLDSVKKSVGTTKGAIDKVGVSTNTFKDGVDGASQSMTKLSNGAANSKELLTELSSQLIGATAIWGAVAIAIVEVGRALYEYATRLNEAEKAEANLNKVREDGISVVSDSIGQFRLLIAIIQDETEAEEQRLLAKQQLAKEYPDFNQQILDESLATDAARKSIDLYIVALKKQGKAKAAASIVAEKEVEIVKEEIQLQKDREELIESIGKRNSLDTGVLDKRLKEAKLIDNVVEREKQLNLLYEEAVSLRSKRNAQEIIAENQVESTELRIRALERERDAILNVQIANTELKEEVVEDPDKPDLNKGANGKSKSKTERIKNAKVFEELTSEELAELRAKEATDFFKDETDKEKGVKAIRDKFRMLLEDEKATTEAEKLKLEESRVLAELELLKATEEQKAEVMQYYSEQIKLAEIEDAEESAKARAAINRDLYNNVIDLAEQAFDQETSIGKAAFEVAKGLRVAQAIMDTIAASTSALKDVPYPYNLAAAASIAIQGGLNVKKILDTKIGGTASVGGNPTQTVQNPSSIQPQQTGFTDLRSQRIQIDPVKVYVLESDITNAQIGVQDTRLVSVIK